MSTEGPAFLEVNDLAVEYRSPARCPQRARRARRRRHFAVFAAEGDHRLGGRVGLRQDISHPGDHRLEEPTAGKVIFEGQDISHLGKKELRGVRREMQVIFQDPFESLDPRLCLRHGGGVLEDPRHPVPGGNGAKR